MILRHLLLPEILELLHAGRLNELHTFIAQQPAPEIADLLTAIAHQDRVLLFRVLPRQLAGDVFSLLEPPFQNRLLEELAHEEIRQVLAGLSPDDRTALFEELPAQVTQGLLGHLSEKDRKQTLALLSYPEDSVGRLMTDRYVKVRPEWSVSQALEHLRKTGIDSETMTMIYITNDKGRLTDDLRLRKLLLADPSVRVSDLLDGHFVCLRSLQDREEAVQVFRKYDLYALPVVDADGILLGIVTVDDILDVAEEEVTEDFHKLATVQPLQVSLKQATVNLLFRKRIGWLLTLIVVNIFTGMGIRVFEGTILKLAALVALLPLLLGSGGNAGAQTATMVVRAIATGEIGRGDWWRLFLREVGVSLSIGLIMAVAAFALGWLLGSVQVGIIVAISMVSIVAVGSLTGVLLPMALNRLHFDPATASVPLITSVADILGVLIYFSIATLVLQV
ncbi:MAG: magnesium transporter [Kiritimatiellia bacterium]|jgi:magnesium transporter|nr:magnesium transporter [Kiritimatiellia bacterium]